MRSLRAIGLLLTVLFLTCSVCPAADTPTNKDFTVSANVTQDLELTGWVKKMSAGQTDPGTEGSTEAFPSPFAFGDLTSTLTGGGDSGCLYAQTWYCVFLVANTSGRSYKIQSSGSSLDGSGNAAGYSLPDESFVLTPAYETLDEWQWTGGSEAQGDDPNTGSDVGDQVSAVGTNDIYDSGTGGASRILRAIYSIPPYANPSDPAYLQARPTGWAPVPLDQHYGPYGGQVSITLVLTGT